MAWFSPSPDPNEIRRQAAISFLRGLAVHLPLDLEAYVLAIQSGQRPDAAFGDLGRALATWSRQQQARLETLNAHYQLADTSLKRANQEIQRLRTDPQGECLAESEAQVGDLTDRLAAAQDALTAVRQSLAAEQFAHREEADRLKAHIAAQDRIIARQQLQLNRILGDTPGAETPGDS